MPESHIDETKAVLEQVAKENGLELVDNIDYQLVELIESVFEAA